ncbi:MAG: 2-amino-4-hydroxy-6-hydroxymethyldihydropteridine diphosphokinase [Bacteroidota bacterium]
MGRVFVGLGSNLGDRLHFLERAVSALEMLPGFRLLKRSFIYETEPVGLTEQPEFLNMVVELATSLPARELLKELKSVEQTLGRTATKRWGPREIDLDLLYHGDTVLDEDGFHIPHQEIPNRKFVLVPLNEIAPDFLDPRRKTAIATLLRQCKDTSKVQKATLTISPHF